MADTVLIAPPDLLDAFSTQHEFGAALAFADSDAVAALEAITRGRPRLVALERLFAASARGAALIDRIRMDPALTACEIRIVAHDAETIAATPPSDGGSAATAATSGNVPVALDEHGTRTAPRFPMPETLEVSLDGRPARLVNVSLGGAQIVTTLALKPSQRVRLALPGGARPLRVSAAVQWATFEMPKEGARYRAGVRFLDANGDAIAQFIADHKAG